MAAVIIDYERLASIRLLDAGQHDDVSQGLCAMEAVAWITGEAHSDEPACASPVVAALVRSWNDSLERLERSVALLPLIPRIAGSRVLGEAGKLLERRRLEIALDWLIQRAAPRWLTAAGFAAEAAILRSLPGFSLANPSALLGQLESLAALLGDARREQSRSEPNVSQYSDDAVWSAISRSGCRAVHMIQEKLREPVLTEREADVFLEVLGCADSLADCAARITALRAAVEELRQTPENADWRDVVRAAAAGALAPTRDIVAAEFRELLDELLRAGEDA